MRVSVVLSSVRSQILSAVAATAGVALPTPADTFAVSFQVFGSIRVRDCVAQLGIQRLPKPFAAPPQGLLRSGLASPKMASPSLLVLLSKRTSVPAAGLGTSRLSAAKVYGGATGSSASAFNNEKGISTPGVFTPPATTGAGCLTSFS